MLSKPTAIAVSATDWPGAASNAIAGVSRLSRASMVYEPSTLEIELIYWPATTFAARAEAQAAFFRYIDGWQKPRRIQQGLVGRSPDEFRCMASQAASTRSATLHRKGAEKPREKRKFTGKPGEVYAGMVR